MGYMLRSQKYPSKQKLHCPSYRNLRSQARFLYIFCLEMTIAYPFGINLHKKHVPESDVMEITKSVRLIRTSVLLH